MVIFGGPVHGLYETVDRAAHADGAEGRLRAFHILRQRDFDLRILVIAVRFRGAVGGDFAADVQGFLEAFDNVVVTQRGAAERALNGVADLPDVDLAETEQGESDGENQQLFFHNRRFAESDQRYCHEVNNS
jgi:hypothetical protein